MFHLLPYVGSARRSSLDTFGGFAAPRMLVAGLLAILASASLAGCAGQKPVIIEKPVVVTRVVYVPISPSLTEHGDVPMPRTNDGREVLRVARTRRTALEQCYSQLDQIEAVQGTEKPSGPSAASPC